MQTRLDIYARIDDLLEFKKCLCENISRTI